MPKHRRSLPGTRSGESGRLVPDISICNRQQHRKASMPMKRDTEGINNSLHGISVYLVNIQCMLARLPELCHHLENEHPHVVCIQETWLDQSVKDVNVPGYTVCSRRDRHEGSNRGGVLTLRRNDFNGLVHIANTADEERSWHFLKTGIETFLLGNWYRPGASDFDGFATLYSEVGEYFTQVNGIVLMGDLNIHHQRWLRYSRENTRIGGEMKAFCDFHGLQQLVREPTRNEYLLDLVISDIPGVNVSVLPRIADHNLDFKRSAME